jgi:hypothetical protein
MSSPGIMPSFVLRIEAMALRTLVSRLTTSWRQGDVSGQPSINGISGISGNQSDPHGRTAHNGHREHCGLVLVKAIIQIAFSQNKAYRTTPINSPALVLSGSGVGGSAILVQTSPTSSCCTCFLDGPRLCLGPRVAQSLRRGRKEASQMTPCFRVLRESITSLTI